MPGWKTGKFVKQLDPLNFFKQLIIYKNQNGCLNQQHLMKEILWYNRSKI